MENKVTVDLILETLQGWVETKTPIDASTWLNAAAKLVVLLSDEQDKLFTLEQKIAERKLNCIETYGDSVAKAKLRIESTDDYREAKKLEAKIDQVTELVRISKLQARLSDDNMKNYR